MARQVFLTSFRRLYSSTENATKMAALTKAKTTELDKSDVKVRLAVLKDAPSLYQMLQELAAVEGASGLKLKMEDLIKDGFSSDPWYTALVAERANEKNLLGCILCSKRYSYLTGRCCYVEVLYVTQNERKNGIGSFLLQALGQMLVDQNVKELDWITKLDNQGMMDGVNKKLGGRDLRETENQTIVSIDEAHIRKMAGWKIRKAE